jgi:hypothetical protein
VALQCGFIRIAADRLYQLQRQPPPWSLDDIWEALQQILVAAANVSKMLWGSEGRYEAERAELRESLDVSYDSPLRDPDLRNDFEHFDQRLESWFESSPTRNYAGRNVGPRDSFPGFDPKEVFQHYDPTTGVVSFWDHSVAVASIAEDAERILGRAKLEEQKPLW